MYTYVWTCSTRIPDLCVHVCLTFEYIYMYAWPWSTCTYIPYICACTPDLEAHACLHDLKVYVDIRLSLPYTYTDFWLHVYFAELLQRVEGSRWRHNQGPQDQAQSSDGPPRGLLLPTSHGRLPKGQSMNQLRYKFHCALTDIKAMWRFWSYKICGWQVEQNRTAYDPSLNQTLPRYPEGTNLTYPVTEFTARTILEHTPWVYDAELDNETIRNNAFEVWWCYD